MKSVTHDELVKNVFLHAKTAVDKKPEMESFRGIMVQSMLDVIAFELLSKGVINLKGIGRLRVVDRPARKGKNPRTGQAVDVPAKKVVRFKASKMLVL